jgi:hypothetical protein
MTFTDFIYATGNVFEAFFTKFALLGNIPNYIFIAVGIFGFLYWLNLQVKYNKAAARNGTLQ